MSSDMFNSLVEDYLEISALKPAEDKYCNVFTTFYVYITVKSPSHSVGDGTGSLMILYTVWSVYKAFLHHFLAILILQIFHSVFSIFCTSHDARQKCVLSNLDE